MLADLFDHLSGGYSQRLQQQQSDAEFNAIIERNNAFARMIGAPEQEAPKSLDQVRLETQILPAFRNQLSGGQASQLSNGQSMLSLLSAGPATSPAEGYTQPAIQFAPQTALSAPAQMSLGQVQPKTASPSATGTTAYPGQRYQPQSLGGFGWQQPQQRQGQPQASPIQTGQQGLGIGGGIPQRRQSGLGMLGQQLIA